MAKLKTHSTRVVEIREQDYLLLLENSIKMEALKNSRYREDGNL